jgi:plasmid replication initiation protein
MAKKYNLDLYKHNDFIKMVQVKKQMSFQQQRIFDTMLSTVQEMKKTGDFIDLVSEGELRMDLDVFKEQMLRGSKIKKVNRNELEDALETMVDIKFKYTIKENNEDKIGTFVIFQKAEIDFNTNEVSVVFGKEFRTENLLPTTNYTALSLEFLNTFSSQYARLLYQYFKMLIGKDYSKPFRTDIVLDIDFIKSLFGINEVEHKMYSKNTSVLIKNTIEMAVIQINEHSDITVSYEKIKRGRKIYSLAFEFKPKPEFIKEKKEQPPEENSTSPLFVPEFKKFRDFRDWIVESYRNKPVVIGPKNYLYNTVIKITSLGYLHNDVANKDLDPDSAQSLWTWMYENQDRIGKVNLSQSEVITLNNRGRFLYVLDQKLNKKVNVKLKKVLVSENDVHCDVVVELENRDEKVIKNYYTIEKLMTSLKDEPHNEEETIEAKIVT